MRMPAMEPIPNDQRIRFASPGSSHLLAGSARDDASLAHVIAAHQAITPWGRGLLRGGGPWARGAALCYGAHPLRMRGGNLDPMRARSPMQVMSQGRRSNLPLAMILLAIVAVHGSALRAPFFADDYLFLEQ